MKLLKTAGVIIVALAVIVVSPVSYAAVSPSLGTASSFSVLAETNITNVPSSTIGRDVGLSPASGTFMGLTDPEVAGTIYSIDGFAPPAANATVNPGLLTTAVNDMTNAWSTGGSTGIDQPCTTSWSGTGPKDLTTVSPLGPGVYCADAFLITGNLTLSGAGVWIFKSASTLTTSAGSTVTGGDPCNVWWRLVSAGSILGANSTSIGNILAGTSVAMQNGATLDGRVLAQAAVTLDQNTITGPACTAFGPPATSTSTTTPGLPDTGLSPQTRTVSWTVIGSILAGALVLGYAFRKSIRKQLK